MSLRIVYLRINLAGSSETLTGSSHANKLWRACSSRGQVE